MVFLRDLMNMIPIVKVYDSTNVLEKSPFCGIIQQSIIYALAQKRNCSCSMAHDRHFPLVELCDDCNDYYTMKMTNISDEIYIIQNEIRDYYYMYHSGSRPMSIPMQSDSFVFFKDETPQTVEDIRVCKKYCDPITNKMCCDYRYLLYKIFNNYYVSYIVEEFYYH